MRFISAKKNEPEWMLAWRLEAFKRWLTMREPKWAKVEYGPIDYQDHLLLLRAEKEGRTEIARRDRSGNPAHLRETRHPAARTGNPARRAESESRGRGRGRRRSRKRQRLWPGRGRRRVQLGLGGNHLPGGIGQGRRAVHADLGSGAAASGPGEEVPWYGGADQRQFLRHPQFRGVLRRLVCLRASGRALPDGTVDLFPDQ